MLILTHISPLVWSETDYNSVRSVLPSIPINPVDSEKEAFCAGYLWGVRVEIFEKVLEVIETMSCKIVCKNAVKSGA